jgi:hypothetical protein
MAKMVSNLAVGAPSFVPRALKFWREHEHQIVLGFLVLSGLSAVVAVAVAVKAAPVALKLASSSVPIKSALAKYGITAATLA